MVSIVKRIRQGNVSESVYNVKMLKIHLLGPFHVEIDNVPITGFESNKVRALLAYLAIERQRPQPRTMIAGLLWPDVPEANALRSLRQALSNLKKNIGEAYLNISRLTIQLNIDAQIWVDVTDLLSQTALIDQGSGAPQSPVPTKEIIALYRGDFLSGLYLGDSEMFDEWAALKREALHNQMINSMLALAQFHQQRGEYEAMLSFSRKHLELEPWSEAAHRQVMIGLSHTDRRSAAVQQYMACKNILERELGVAPASETTQLFNRIRDAKPRHNLPEQPNTLVGRKEELAQIQMALASPANRLLTLSGPGGIGKTRLAIQVAHKRVHAYLHGIIFVSLTEIDNPMLLFPKIADAAKMTILGPAPLKEQLIDFFRAKELLLVLDNFEQLADSATELSDLLEAAPELNILITSRERLRLRWETVLQIGGLPYETPNSDAATLFESAAQRATAKFSLNESNRGRVQKICELVEGMPLGIELTAAWIQDHALEEITSQLQAGLEILHSDMRDANPRHQSMQVVFSQSWELLSPAEETLLKQLTVFRGPFTTAAVQKIFGKPVALQGLIDKSLVQVIQEDGRSYYRLHELIRQFSLEKFKQAPKVYQASRTEHATYYLTFLGENTLNFVQEDDSIRREIPFIINNVRTAWDWAIENRLTHLIEQATEGLFALYRLKDWHIEYLEAFTKASERYAPANSDPASETYCLLLKNKGMGFALTNQYDEAIQTLLACAELTKSFDNQLLAAQVLDQLGYAQILKGDLESAQKNIDAAISIGEKILDSALLGEAYNHYGFLHNGLGNTQEELDGYTRAVEIYRPMGHQLGLLKAFNNLGIFHAYRGNFAEARGLLEKTLAIAQRLGVRGLASRTIGNLAMLEAMDGNHQKGIELQTEQLKSARDIGNQAPLAHALIKLGAMLARADSSENILLYYEEGLAIFEKINSKFGVSFALLNLAGYYLDNGEIDLAAANYQQALSISVEISHAYHMRQSILGYAQVAEKRNQDSEALEIAGAIRSIPDLESENVRSAEKVLALLKAKVSSEQFEQLTCVAPPSNEAVTQMATTLLNSSS